MKHHADCYVLTRITLFSLLALLLNGCATGPVAYDIRGEADPVINRDAEGKPLSVVVRLYQLTQPDEFNKLTFETLASGRPEAELLGEELVAKTELVLVPGQTHVSTDKMLEKARYLGVVGFFRTPEANYWRYLIKADAVRDKGLIFKAHDCYLALQNQKPQTIPGQPENITPVCVNVQVAEPKPAPRKDNRASTAKAKTPYTPSKRYPSTTQPVDPEFVDKVIDRVTDRATQRAVEYAIDKALPASTPTLPTGAYKP